MTSTIPDADLRVIAASQWVEATPFRAWVRQLVSDTGLPWRVIARLAQVPSATVQHLLCGRGGRSVGLLRQVDAQRLYDLNLRSLAALAGEPARCETLRLLTWSLGLRGCTPEQVAEFIDLPATTVRHLMAGGPIWCSRLHQVRAEAACEAWGIDPDQVLRNDGTPRVRRAA